MGSARRRLSPEDRRAELLALGAEVFGKRPYDEVRIDEIAERAGVSRALMYHYFPDKDVYKRQPLNSGSMERTPDADSCRRPVRSPSSKRPAGLVSGWTPVSRPVR